MDRSSEFLRERGIDQLLSRHPAQALEQRGNDKDPEMALSPGARARMTFMLRAVVDHLKPDRFQSTCQFVADRCCNVHCHLLLRRKASVKCFVFLSFTQTIP